jgi:autophagy-related protein 101
VEEYAEAFSNALEERRAQSSESGDTRRAQICISFFERRSRPAAFGLFRSDEKVTWERWQIALAVHPLAAGAAGSGLTEADGMGAVAGSGGACDCQSRDSCSPPAAVAAPELRRRQQEQLCEELRSRLEVILSTAAARKEHIPPVDGLGGEGTWFEVTSDASDAWTNGLDMFKLGFGRIPRTNF